MADCKPSESIFHGLMNFLEARAYTVTLDPRIERDYKCLSKSHRRICRSTPDGLFECDAEWYPKGMKLECYQNVVFENKCGGRYDFSKLSKMPFLIRMRFLHFSKIVGQYFATECIQEDPRLPDNASPLDQFNDGWKSDRFRRGNDGWPDQSELKSWRQITRDGVAITQGMRAYSLHYNKRWVSGRLFGGINGMWKLYDNTNKMIDNHNASHYFAHPTHVCKGRVIEADRDKLALRKKLDSAFKSDDFKAVARLAKAAERLLTSAI